MLKGYIQSNNIIYDVLVLKENARPLRSLAKPMRAFFDSSVANIGDSDAANNWPMLSNAAEIEETFI